MINPLFSATRPAGKWILLVLVLFLAASACVGPYGRYGYDRGLSRGEILNMARQAVYDYVIRRYGRDAQPGMSSLDIRALSRVEAQVFGRITFYRSARDRGRIRMNFRCAVDRFNGSVRGIDLY
ncbi:MAG: hypothetical protein NTZ26_07915 [Candidatus Aminicenantes bacterium]|nr:hypothetical protein [Candidatus Aminicenantes bacterium]